MKKTTKICIIVGALALMVGFGITTYKLKIDPPFGLMIQEIMQK